MSSSPIRSAKKAPSDQRPFLLSTQTPSARGKIQSSRVPTFSSLEDRASAISPSSFPLALSGVSTVSTPELTLFAFFSRIRMSASIRADSKSGSVIRPKLPSATLISFTLVQPTSLGSKHSQKFPNRYAIDTMSFHKVSGDTTNLLRNPHKILPQLVNYCRCHAVPILSPKVSLLPPPLPFPRTAAILSPSDITAPI